MPSHASRSSLRLILADRAVAALIGLVLLVMLGVGLVLSILPLFRFSGDLGFTLGPLVAGVSAGVLGFRGAFALAAVPTALALVVVLRSTGTLRARQISQPQPEQ